MNVTQIFCDADDFCQRFIPDWKKHGWKGRKKRQQEPGRVQFARVKSLRWWFVIIFLATGRSNGSMWDLLKNTGWQTFLVCQATTVLLNWCPMSWYRLPRLCRTVAAKAMALPLPIRRLCVFAKTSASHATKPSRMWRGVVSRQRAGFMALSVIW